MIKISDKKDCCGCWACAGICAHHSIGMVEDGEGYRYPVVDVDTCTNCGMCESVCPLLSFPIANKDSYKKPVSAFLAQNKDEKVLRESTSGGAFSAIANWVIKNNGVVYGAAFGDNGEVIHMAVDTVDELYRFRNSKYVQSLIGDAYNNTKKLLLAGKWVCFSGTPCQLEGLLNFLHKPYDRLVTVDVVCRAVPSPLVLRRYLEMQRKSFDFSEVRFRDKYHGYKYSSMSLNGGDKEYHEGIDTDYYLRTFFAGVNIRPSCTDCKFRSPLRRTDFTIWDCFDAYRFNSRLDNDKGVTRMLTRTQKAEDILSDISNELKLVKIDVSQAVFGVKELVQSPVSHPFRNDFFKDLVTMDAEDCFKKYFPITIRCKVEKQVRLWSARLGVYQLMKRIFLIMHRGRTIKR